MISIHALRGEGDNFIALSGGQGISFQSTPSVGRATTSNNSEYNHPKISIHALRGEGDKSTRKSRKSTCKFQSTPSVGRATTITVPIILKRKDFNPRPPWGGRLDLFIINILILGFQSTPSVGRATCMALFYIVVLIFQSTPSVGRATAKIYKYAMLCLYIVHIKLYIFATAVLFT